MDEGTAAAGKAAIDMEFVDRFRRPATQGNWIRDIHPIIAFVVLAIVTVIPVVLPGSLPAAALCLLFVVLSLLAGVGRAFIGTYFKLFLAVGLILFLLRAAFDPGSNVIFRFGPIAPTVEGVESGLRFSLVVMAMCGAVTLYAALIPAKYLMLALEDRGVTPRATYVLLASLQAISDLGKNARTVMDAQQSRGIETGGSFMTRIKAFFPILAPVFLTAMNQTEERAIALDARAFNAKAAHSHLVTLRKVRTWEIGLLAVAVALLALSILGALLSWY